MKLTSHLQDTLNNLSRETESLALTDDLGDLYDSAMNTIELVHGAMQQEVGTNHLDIYRMSLNATFYQQIDEAQEVLRQELEIVSLLASNPDLSLHS